MIIHCTQCKVHSCNTLTPKVHAKAFKFHIMCLASDQSPTPNNAIKCQPSRLSHWSAQIITISFVLCSMGWCLLLAMIQVQSSAWGMLSPQVTLAWYRVLTSPEKPGKSWNFVAFSRTGTGPGKRPLVLENSGNMLNSTRRYEVYGRP